MPVQAEVGLDLALNSELLSTVLPVTSRLKTVILIELATVRTRLPKFNVCLDLLVLMASAVALITGRQKNEALKQQTYGVMVRV